MSNQPVKRPEPREILVAVDYTDAWVHERQMKYDAQEADAYMDTLETRCAELEDEVAWLEQLNRLSISNAAHYVHQLDELRGAVAKIAKLEAENARLKQTRYGQTLRRADDANNDLTRAVAEQAETITGLRAITVEKLTDSVYSYWEHMPGHAADDFPTYGTIKCLIEQGLSAALEDTHE